MSPSTSNGFQTLFAVNNIVNQDAFFLAFVEEDGREGIVAENALDEFAPVALVPEQIAAGNRGPGSGARARKGSEDPGRSWWLFCA